MKSLFSAGLVLTAIFASVPAGAVTYHLNRSIGGGSAVGTITTDGTIGVLGNDNITDFNIEVSLLGFTRTVMKTGGGYSIVGSAFTASTAGLSFDFVAGDNSYVYFSSGGSYMPTFYCLQANGACIDNNGPGEGLLTYNVSTRTPRAGNVQFASAIDGVPEPATWATMVAGFGAIGRAMRRRKVAVSFA